MKPLLKYALVIASGFGILCLLVFSIYPQTGTRVLAHAVAPGGEEFYVIQTFKGFGEPYQVSLLGRRAGQEWAWNYLAHQDSSWEGCRIEVVGDTVRVIRDPSAGRTFSLDRVFVRNPSTGRTLTLQKAADLPKPSEGRPLPADYSSEQLVAWHHEIWGD